ncbi:phosphoribosyltransferase [Arenibacter sp. F26102]|uniref:phosphoribosyltransferase n=1 Tax=Arenibacter sp. F26102 TaxID=2926416 RepID=UPI001FF2AB08|nr:phosphoribosyltransferase family protein [Arenibacter sp. F26102]MCK0144358.1 phosphoribosyltransferase [Arenibacter sp. F26102]
MFKDRIDAGEQLAKKLSSYKDKENVVILAIPRGGLPLGAIVAKSLNAQLDVALSKKIGHPFNKEFAIGAVSLNNIILDDNIEVSIDYIEKEKKRLREKLKKRQAQYYKNRFPIALKDKIVIIIDDGIATGNTIRVTAQLVYDQKPEKIMIAIPVAPKSTVQKLRDATYVDEVVCLETPFNFQAVGQFYMDFDQLSDEEAIKILEDFNS